MRAAAGNFIAGTEYARLVLLLNYSTGDTVTRYAGMKLYKSKKIFTSIYAKNGGQSTVDSDGKLIIDYNGNVTLTIYKLQELVLIILVLATSVLEPQIQELINYLLMVILMLLVLLPPVLSGPMSGTLNSANAAGAFASNTGGGNFSFPGSLGIGTIIPRSKLEVVSGTANINADPAGTAADFTSATPSGNGSIVSIESNDTAAANMGGVLGLVVDILVLYANWASIKGLKTDATSGNYGGYLSLTCLNALLHGND